MPVSRVFTQRNAAAVFLLSTAGVLYTMNKPTHVRAPATTTGTGAQSTYQIPSFALGGCERSGGGV